MSADFRFKSREWFKGAPHRAAVAAETAKAVRAFDTAAKKVQKAIAAIAAGDNPTEKTLRDLFRNLSSLEGRLSKPEIRGDREAYAKYDKVVSALRRSVEPAIEAGETARSAERDRARLASLSEDRGERHARRSNADIATRQYQDELAINRGRR